MAFVAMPAGQDADRPAINAASQHRSNSRFAESFAQIVAVLMCDRSLRTLPICELEWMVLPPLMVGQFGIAHAPIQGASTKLTNDIRPQEKPALLPVAVALWARVSDDLDRRLSENPERPPRLQPSSWTSGENIWVIAAGGDHRALPKFIDQLVVREFQGKKVKIGVRGSDGKVRVKVLGSYA